MTICPIALAVLCKGCPLVKFCPAKSLLGDFDTCIEKVESPDMETETKQSETE